MTSRAALPRLAPVLPFAFTFAAAVASAQTPRQADAPSIPEMETALEHFWAAALAHGRLGRVGLPHRGVQRDVHAGVHAPRERCQPNRKRRLAARAGQQRSERPAILPRIGPAPLDGSLLLAPGL